jgi:serine/threonine protein kinase
MAPDEESFELIERRHENAELSLTDSEAVISADSSQTSAVEAIDFLHLVQFLAVRRVSVIPAEQLTYTVASVSHEGIYTARVRDGSWNGKRVALKTARIGSTSGITLGQTHLRAFLKELLFEISIMSHDPLCTHPNIARIIGISFFESSDSFSPVLVLEPACEVTPDLHSLVSSKAHSMAPELIASLISDVADGVSALHTYHIVHGDLKPQNILVFDSQIPVGLQARIADFGMSGIQSNGEMVRGFTPSWAAPELLVESARNLELRDSPLQDIYSFGLICSFIIIGSEEFYRLRKDSEDAGSSLIQAAREVLGLFPETDSTPYLRNLPPILRRALDENPGDRPLILNVRESLFGYDIAFSAIFQFKYSY